MAKIRIQARSADAEDAEEEHHDKPAPHHFHHDKYKHPGAVTLLYRVLKKEGFLGWYQVLSDVNQFTFTTDVVYTGNVRSNTKGSSESGSPFLVEGAVRALGARYHGFPVSYTAQSISIDLHSRHHNAVSQPYGSNAIHDILLLVDGHLSVYQCCPGSSVNE